MSQQRSSGGGVWLAVGVLLGGALVGIVAIGMGPQTPLYASATHGQDSFAICTGMLDEGTEAIFFLDFLTGDLKGAVLNPNAGKFTTWFAHNVLDDLEIGGIKNPKYLLVTGSADLRRGAGRARIGKSVIYVCEVTSGTVAAYAVQYDPTRVVTGAPTAVPFVPLDRTQFRTAAIRPK